MDTMDWNPQPRTEMADQCITAMEAALDSDELKMLMYELALENLDTFRFKPSPSRPLVLTRFNADKNTSEWQDKTLAEKDNITKRIMDKADVKAYYEDTYTLTQENYGSVTHLEEMISAFLEWDETAKAKECWSVYQDYPDTLVIGGELLLWQRKKKW